jgi:4-hydroxybenzoate polyprenyltransferase
LATPSLTVPQQVDSTSQLQAVSARPQPITSAIISALRPRQWTKNGLIFVALAFSLKLSELQVAATAFLAFLCFCALSSAGYLLNDVLDVEADRRHPTKRLRPIAAGRLPVGYAIALSGMLAMCGVLAAVLIRPAFGIVAIAYLALTASYTTSLKHMVLLDVFGIAGGFVIRAAAGAMAIDVPVSPWLYVATLLGALLIALGKRRAELQVLGVEAGRHRRNLNAYTLEFVDQLILIIAGAAVMTYALYTFSAETLPKNHSMMLTIPVVLYGLFRYLFLIRQPAVGGAPEDLLFSDRPLLVAAVVWAVLAVAILYIGQLF